MPIYFVLWEQDHSHWNPNYLMKKILAVYPCDMSEINAIWEKVVRPLNNNGRAIQTEIYLREPSNPFKGFENKELVP